MAHMIAELEAVHSWLESITYKMCNMTYGVTFRSL
jgi:hypothetical protein